MNDLSPIQKEIAAALEQMKEKYLITEAILAKRVRENAKIQGKNKAGICLKDLEAYSILSTRNYGLCGLYVALSVVGCIAGVWCGKKLATLV